ncbi:MAG TPA: spore germination lipoprotein GerD [Virgibacillus sp.]|nr:spore germination lipoprotein GerD [Virgibacillus sp.]HLR69505.1 spore germination lipoprotein GerD [Virgibacillus sp.]
MKRAILLGLFAIFILTGCLNETSSKKELDYDQTKKMVVDILQTDEGKKVLQEIITDDKMKQHLVMDSDVVEQSIKDTFESKESANMWQELFEDPAFVESYQKSMNDEQKKLFKNLMHDATFQNQMLDLLQNPEITNQMLIVLKGQQFREHLEKTIQETIETPLFQSKIQHLLLEAAKKQQTEEDKKEDKQESENEDEQEDESEGDVEEESKEETGE